MSNTKIKAGQFSGIVGNGTDGYFLMTNGDGTMAWEPAGAPSPTVTSVTYPGDDTAADPAGGQSVTLTGTNFATGATVTIGGTTAPTVSFVSATELTITTPAKTAGDYDIVVTNTDGGTATFVDGISYNGIPSWTTASGSLGTFASDTTISTITLQASEPDAGTITFSITNGALPTGLSLTGADIDGATSKETADTLYNFTVTAIDDENQSTPRAFSITVEKYIVPAPENFEIVTYTGNGGTQAITSKIGKAASFNGSSSYIDLGNSAPFGDRDDIKAISGWIKTNGTTNNDIHNAWLYSVSGTEDAIDWFYVGYRPTTNRIQVYRRLDTNNYAQTDATITPDTNWHHIVVQLTATEVEIYLDGQKLTTTNTNAGTGSNTSWISYGAYGGTVKSMIGKSRQNTPKYYDGLIDQIRFFNRALDETTDGEVTTLYNETYASSTKSTTDIFGDGSGVALYELDEDANDTGGVSGKFGGGATFSSTSVSKVNTGIGSLSNNFSVFMWVKIQDISVANSFFGNWNATTADDIYLSHNTDGQLRLGIDGVSNQYFGANGDITENTWHHIGFTFSNGTVTAYIDGSNKGTTTTSNTSFSSGLPFVIGSYSSRTDANGYDVTIDDVRIYSDVLTSQEVGYLYNNTTASIPTDNLTAYYKFEGNSNDEQGNYDGTDSNVTYRYDGTPTNVNFLGMAFQPDLVWIKARSGTYGSNPHRLEDSVRGSFYLSTSSTAGEAAVGTGIQSYDTNGFTVGSGNSYNGSSTDFVAWCWKAGGAAVSGTGTGSITNVSYSANADAGFSIVKYTGSGTAGTVTHGLSAAPELMFIKSLDSSLNWVAAQTTLEVARHLNTADQLLTSSYNAYFSSNPTTSLINLTSNSTVNTLNDDYIAYCFHSVDGYQKVGSYTGTGQPNNDITTGFRPRWVMIKSTAAQGWNIVDSVRNPSNPANLNIQANDNAAESSTANPAVQVDFDDTGFSLVAPAGTPGEGQVNSNGTTYIYLAIA